MARIHQLLPAPAIGTDHCGGQRRQRAVAVPPLRTVEERITRRRDEWILRKVLGFDEDGWPERGLVLAHSPRRGRISQVLAEEPPRTAPPGRTLRALLHLPRISALPDVADPGDAASGN